MAANTLHNEYLSQGDAGSFSSSKSEERSQPPYSAGSSKIVMPYDAPVLNSGASGNVGLASAMETLSSERLHGTINNTPVTNPVPVSMTCNENFKHSQPSSSYEDYELEYEITKPPKKVRPRKKAEEDGVEDLLPQTVLPDLTIAEDASYPGVGASAAIALAVAASNLAEAESSETPASTSEPLENIDGPPVVLVYHCWICTAEFMDKLGIVRHLHEWHKDKPEVQGLERKMKVPICIVCGADTGMCEHHGGIDASVNYDGLEDADDDNSRDSLPRSCIINCISCDKTFVNTTSLRKHRQEEHPDEKSFQCMYCPSTFTENSHLVVHTRIHTGCKPYICTECGSRFPKSSDLKRHLRVHSGEKPFHCRQCNQSFTQKSSLEKHAKLHAKRMGGHACLQCGLVFMEHQDLQDHLASAHEDVNWQCKLCGKMYVEERHLILHEKSHYNIKPFACSYCDRRFSFRPLLTKHEEKIHKTKREIKCEECGKEFKRRENLARHMASHSGIKSFRCDVCGIGFTEKGSLTRHTKSQHYQLRPHTCTICNKAFTRKVLVRKHMNRYHVNQPVEKELKRVLFFKCKICKKVLRKSGLRQHAGHHKKKGDEWEGDIDDSNFHGYDNMEAANQEALDGSYDNGDLVSMDLADAESGLNFHQGYADGSMLSYTDSLASMAMGQTGQVDTGQLGTGQYEDYGASKDEQQYSSEDETE